MTRDQIQRRTCCFVLAVIIQTVVATPAGATLLPNGVIKDDQASIAYSAATGELAIDAPASRLFTSINIDSRAGIFTERPALKLDGSFDNDADVNIFKATFGANFDSLNFGPVAQAGLDEQFVLNDLSVVGSLWQGGELGDVDLIYVTQGPLLISTGSAFNGSFSADTDMNRLQLDVGAVPMAESAPELAFQVTNLGIADVAASSSMDLVSIVRSGSDDRFSTDLAPFTNLTPGDTRNFSATLDTYQLGRFRSDLELRLVNSSNPTDSEVLQLELKGRVVDPPVGKLLPDGAGDGTLPIVSYDPGSGELFLTSEIGLTAINITSASGIFAGPTPTDVLDGSFDNHDANNVFKATFGDSFGNLSFGPVAAKGLSIEFLMSDLTITGSRAAGGGLNNVVFARFIAIPEPGTMLLSLIGAMSLLAGCVARLLQVHASASGFNANN